MLKINRDKHLVLVATVAIVRFSSYRSHRQSFVISFSIYNWCNKCSEFGYYDRMRFKYLRMLLQCYSNYRLRNHHIRPIHMWLVKYSHGMCVACVLGWAGLCVCVCVLIINCVNLQKLYEIYFYTVILSSEQKIHEFGKWFVIVLCSRLFVFFLHAKFRFIPQYWVIHILLSEWKK